MWIEAAITTVILLGVMFIGLPYYEAHKRRKQLLQRKALEHTRRR